MLDVGPDLLVDGGAVEMLDVDGEARGDRCVQLRTTALAKLCSAPSDSRGPAAAMAFVRFAISLSMSAGLGHGVGAPSTFNCFAIRVYRDR
jgi:hypothetical protein